MAQTLLILQVLMLINLMFFITRITKLFILRKIGKSMEIANSSTVVDGTMFTIGIMSFIWAKNLRENILIINQNFKSKSTNHRNSHDSDIVT